MHYLLLVALCSLSLTQAMETQSTTSTKVLALAAQWNQRAKLPSSTAPKTLMHTSIEEDPEEAELAAALPLRSQSVTTAPTASTRIPVTRSYSAPAFTYVTTLSSLPSISEMDEIGSASVAQNEPSEVLVRLFMLEEPTVRISAV